jgi:hypothetical protein
MKDLFIFCKTGISNVKNTLGNIGVRYIYGDSYSQYIFTNGKITIAKSSMPNNLSEFKRGMNSYTYMGEYILNLSEIEFIEITDIPLFINLASILHNSKDNSLTSDIFYWFTCIISTEFEGKYYQPGDMIFCKQALIKDSLCFKLSSIDEVLSQFGKKESDLTKNKLI